MKNLLLFCFLFLLQTHAVALMEDDPLSSRGMHADPQQRDCREDGRIDTTGANDSSAVINACIAKGLRNHQPNILLPCGKLLVNTAINMTNKPGMNLRGCSSQFQFSQLVIANVGITVLLCNSGTVCIDTTGSGDQHISDLVLYLGGSGISNPSPIGILQGRDNAGAGGPSKHFCFAERQSFENFAIMDFTSGGLNTTANGGRGYIGIYNYGAESGEYRNYGVFTAAPFIFTNSNVASVSSPYQTLGTGCRVTMTGELLETGTTTSFQRHPVAQPNIEADGTANMSIINNTFIGGSCGIKFEGSMAVKWHVVANQERVASPGSFLCNSVDLADSFFHVMAPGPTAFLNPTADNLTYINDQFFFSTKGALVPLITNTATGTRIIGGYASFSAPTKASNTTIMGTTIVAPNETRSELESSFNPASEFFPIASDGIGKIGPK